MDEITTTDLAQFGNREKHLAGVLLLAMINQGLPEDFNDGGVTVMMNKNSGNVFLTNSDYQVAMMNGHKLESFYSCPECGCEGFADDLVTDFKFKNANRCCMEYLKDAGAIDTIPEVA